MSAVIRHSWTQERYRNVDVLLCAPGTTRDTDCKGCGIRLPKFRAYFAFPYAKDFESGADLMIAADLFDEQRGLRWAS